MKVENFNVEVVIINGFLKTIKSIIIKNEILKINNKENDN